MDRGSSDGVWVRGRGFCFVIVGWEAGVAYC
jgi:6-phosphogluconate dehydrogenase (decarboxylating)